MTIQSPILAALLADLSARGIDLEPHGNGFRYCPMSAMTPDLLVRLQDNKAELLKWMDMAELRRSIDRLWSDQTWVAAWKLRFQAATYANLDSLRRVLALILELAEQNHRQRNWSAFNGTVKYLYRVASGEQWQITAPPPPDLTLLH